VFETCPDCGKTSGVTMTPRVGVQCTDCARPKPWYRPAAYWAHQALGFLWPYAHPHSVEWHDQHTSRCDLRIAADLALTLDDGR
jgi:hypothetical protein